MVSIGGGHNLLYEKSSVIHTHTHTTQHNKTRNPIRANNQVKQGGKGIYRITRGIYRNHFIFIHLQ